jgi:MEDS: MEthanogen/methylotroph, DcmR Sensory domain
MTTRIQYQQGDHVCALYSTREEQLSAAVEYVRSGLARGERCLWVCCEHTPDDFRAALDAAGIAVAAEESRGALVLLTKHEGHLSGGYFDPDKMIHMLHTAVREALDLGFSGLCAGGDMSWLLDEAEGSERVAEYEARLNAFYPSSKSLGLCLYNRHRLPTAALDHSLATHPYVRVGSNLLMNNPFYEPHEQAMLRTADGGAFPRKDAWFQSELAGL